MAGATHDFWMNLWGNYVFASEQLHGAISSDCPERDISVSN